MNTGKTTRVINSGTREELTDLIMEMERELYKRSVKIIKRDVLIESLRNNIKKWLDFTQ